MLVGEGRAVFRGNSVSRTQVEHFASGGRPVSRGPLSLYALDGGE